MELEQIEIAMGLRHLPAPDRIAHQDVLRWMASDDIEVLGAVYTMVTEPKFLSRFDKPVDSETYRSFFLRYFERCIRDDPDGEWPETRYEAAHDFVSWFENLWRDSPMSRSVLSELRAFLRRLIIDGNTEIRECVVTGILEHLFQEDGIRKEFRDWGDDPLLKATYEESCALALNFRKFQGTK